MSEVYPPSPNWYQSSCCAILNKVLAYGSREHIILIDVRNGHVLRRINGSRIGSRVVAVAFGVYGLPQSRTFVAAAYENSNLSIYDIDSGITVFACMSAAGVQLTSCCLATSSGRSDNVALVAGDARGRFSVWINNERSGGGEETEIAKVSLTTCHSVQLCNGSAVAVLRTCLWDPRYFAAVATNGIAALFFVRNVGPPLELCRFTAFDGSCTVEDAQWAFDEMTGSLYLAISAKGQLRVFIVDSLLNKSSDTSSHPKRSDGTSIVTVKEFNTVRVKQTQQQQSQQRGTNSRQWSPVAWARCGQNAKALTLLSCDSRGTILPWILNAENQRLVPAPSSIVRFVAGVHTRPIFNLVVDMHESRQMIISSGMDRTLAAWDCATGKRVWTVSTLGGYVYSMDSSPLEPHRLYFSLGDNTIHTWNLPTSESSAHSLYDGRTFWKGLQAKVTCIALHPVLPGLLAFGLDDGRSGVYNIADSGVRSMRGSQKGAIYSLSWQDLSDGSSFTLWSASVDGTILAHGGADRGLATAVDEPVTFDNMIERSTWFQALSPAEREEKRLTLCVRHSSVAASSDSSLLCVGNKNGSVFVLGSGFVPIRQTKLHSQPVSRIRWSLVHPHLAATASDDSSIQILDSDSPDQTPMLLRGKHRGAVYDVAWAPRSCSNTRLLASGAADGLVLLWDTSNGSCLGAIQSDTSLGAALSVHWCVDVPNFVFSGGIDQSVYMCDVSAVVPLSTISIPSKQTPSTSVVRKSAGAGMKRPQPTDQTALQGQPAKQLKQSDDGISADENDAGLFDMNNTMFKQSDEELIACCNAILNGSKMDSKLSFVQAVTQQSHKQVLETIDKNSVQTKATKSHLLVLEGDMRALAEHCADSTHNITALELALLPALGRDVWEAGVALYAEQQEAAGNSTTAATCLATINRVPAAIEVLMRAKQYAEALAMQSSRAPCDTELRNKILTSWGNNYEHSGQHLQAAECFIAAGFHATAATCLEQMLIMHGDDTAEGIVSKRRQIEEMLKRLKSSQSLP